VGHPHRVGPTAANPIEIGSANNLPGLAPTGPGNIHRQFPSGGLILSPTLESLRAAVAKPCRCAVSGNNETMLRCLLVEAAQASARLDPKFRRDYQRLKFRRGHSGLAKVAMARKLAVRLHWKLREAARPAPLARMQGSPASPVVGESLSSY